MQVADGSVAAKAILRQSQAVCSRTAPCHWTVNAVTFTQVRMPPEHPQVQRLSDVVAKAKAAAKALCDAARALPAAAQRPANGFVKRAHASASGVAEGEPPTKRHMGGGAHAVPRGSTMRTVTAGGAGAGDRGGLPAQRHVGAGAHAAPRDGGWQGSTAGDIGGAGAQGSPRGEPVVAGHDSTVVGVGRGEGAELGITKEGLGEAAGAVHAAAAALDEGPPSKAPAPATSAEADPPCAAAAAAPGACASTKGPAVAHGSSAEQASAHDGHELGCSRAAAAAPENPAPPAAAPASAEAPLAAGAAGPEAPAASAPVGAAPAAGDAARSMAARRVPAEANAAGVSAPAAAAGGAGARAGPTAGSRARGAERVPAELLRLLDGGLGLGGPGFTVGARRAAARPALVCPSDTGPESDPESATAPVRRGVRGRGRGRGGRAAAGAKRKSVSITELARGPAAGSPKPHTLKLSTKPGAAAEAAGGARGGGRLRKRAHADDLSADLGCVMAYKVGAGH